MVSWPPPPPATQALHAFFSSQHQQHAQHTTQSLHAHASTPIKVVGHNHPHHNSTNNDNTSINTGSIQPTVSAPAPLSNQQADVRSTEAAVHGSNRVQASVQQMQQQPASMGAQHGQQVQVPSQHAQQNQSAAATATASVTADPVTIHHSAFYTMQSQDAAVQSTSCAWARPSGASATAQVHAHAMHHASPCLDMGMPDALHGAALQYSQQLVPQQPGEDAWGGGLDPELHQMLADLIGPPAAQTHGSVETCELGCTSNFTANNPFQQQQKATPGGLSPYQHQQHQYTHHASMSTSVDAQRASLNYGLQPMQYNGPMGYGAASLDPIPMSGYHLGAMQTVPESNAAAISSMQGPCSSDAIPNEAGHTSAHGLNSFTAALDGCGTDVDADSAGADMADCDMMDRSHGGTMSGDGDGLGGGSGGKTGSGGGNKAGRLYGVPGSKKGRENLPKPAVNVSCTCCNMPLQGLA